jgi:4-hydroxy-tetrahydrodipicolinate synthase
MPDLSGVYPILNTTFRDDGSLDLDSQIRLLNYVLEAGVHGIGLFGNAGEGYTLTAAEKRQLQQVITRETGGRVPLVVSSGHTGTDAAVENSKAAEALGADALMILPPYYMKTNADGIFRYFEAIGNAVSIPIMVQDAPLMTQVPLPPPLLAKLAREIECVAYVKVEAPPTAPKITAILEAGRDAVLFGGLNGLFLFEEHQRGSRGVMPNCDMIPQYVEIWNLLEAGRKKEAWERFVHILPLIRFELQPGLGVSAAKHNMLARGVIKSAAVRHPTSSLDSLGLSELETLRDWVDAAQPQVA